MSLSIGAAPAWLLAHTGLPRVQIARAARRTHSKCKLKPRKSSSSFENQRGPVWILSQSLIRRFYSSAASRPPIWSTKHQPGLTKFSIDLRWRIRAYLKLLEKIQLRPDLIMPGVALDEAIYRYKVYMNSICNGETRRWSWDETPTSVQWIWTIHSLNTKSYESTCLEAVDRIIPRVNPLPGKGLLSLIPSSLGSFSPSTASLEAAVMRQADFYNKVTDFKNASDAQLDICIQNYARFLHMIETTKRVDYVPTVAIDLVWHAHMTEPLAYSQDIQRICNRVLHHDDTIAESQLQHRYNTTAEQWFILYQTDYSSTNTAWKESQKVNESSSGDISCGTTGCGSTTVGGHDSSGGQGGGEGSGDAGGTSCSGGSSCGGGCGGD